ncbi:MAG: hypothetical protein Q7S89_00040 [bacterium]|nr:hypothetical protein [bacterium]
MAIVNFSVPKQLEKRVETTIKEKGFASKAEFFRFAAIHFMDVLTRPSRSVDDAYEVAMRQLTHAVQEKLRGKELPSLEDQLADLR